MTRTAGRSDKTVTRLPTSSYKVTPTAGACTAGARQIHWKTPRSGRKRVITPTDHTQGHPNTTAHAILTVGNLRKRTYAAEPLRNVLNVDSSRFIIGERLPATVLHDDGGVTRAGRRMDVDSDGLPTDDVIAIPVPRRDGRSSYFSVTAVTHIARPTEEQRQVAALLAHLAAGSLALEAGASPAP